MLKRISVLLGLLALFAAGDEKVRIAADYWYPYTGEQGEKPGYMVEIMELVYGKERIRYEQRPWSRCINETEKGGYDMALGADPEESEKLLFPKISIGESANDFFVRRGDVWRYENSASFQGRTFGLIHDYGYGEDLENFSQENPDSVQFIGGEEPVRANILKLIYGRINTIVDARAVIESEARNLGRLDEIEFAGTDDNSPLYPAFTPSQRGEALKNEYEVRMRELVGSKAFQGVLEKYGIKAWEGLKN